MGRWFHADLKRRVAYLKCLTAGAPRYDMHGNVLGTVSEEEAAYAAVKLAYGRAQLAELRAGVKAKKGPEAAAAVKCGDAGQGKENILTTDREDLAVRIWRQVEHCQRQC